MGGLGVVWLDIRYLLEGPRRVLVDQLRGGWVLSLRRHILDRGVNVHNGRAS